jgi:hypothetical protein
MKTCIEKVFSGTYKSVKGKPQKTFKNVKHYKKTKNLKKSSKK